MFNKEVRGNVMNIKFGKGNIGRSVSVVFLGILLIVSVFTTIGDAKLYLTNGKYLTDR